MRTKKPDTKRAKKHLDRLREIISQNPPPIYKLNEDEIIKKLRKTREEIWEEKLALRN